MKLTQILYRQNIGWHFKKHWHVQAKRKPMKAAGIKILEDKGVHIHQPVDFIKEKKRIIEKIEVIGYKEKPVVFDETHPDWHNEPLFQFKDDHVLVEGLKQAKILTKTVELQEGLPESFKLKDIPKEIDSLAKQIVKNCQMFDTEQKKLPKIKDPQRPYHTFSRVYGITQNRRNNLTISKFLQLIESTSETQLVKDKYLFNDLIFSFPFKSNDHKVQLRLTGDYFLSSSKPLKAITNQTIGNEKIPGMGPLEPVVSILKENIYRIENIYPINPTVKKKYPHTLFVFFNREEIKNQFEEPVTDSQIHGRSLLKAFTAAASFAKQNYGDDVKDLPEPVTIQCVQTDGHMFHFGVFQLNTLDLEEGDTKNIWYQTPFQYLFENCSYKLAKPTLEGYNNDVLKHLYAFYNNV